MTLRLSLITLVAAAVAAGLFVAGKHLHRAQSESDRLPQAEQAYAEGIRFLRNNQPTKALAPLDEAMAVASLQSQVCPQGGLDHQSVIDHVSA